MTASRIIAALRTAVVPTGGAFARLGIEALGGPVVRAVLAQAGIAPDQVDEIIVSNALGAGGNPARRIALAAGLPERVAGLTIDRQCAGGLDAILLGRALIDSGAAKVVIAGGVESHSRRPQRLATDPDGGPAVAYDQAPFTPWPDRDPGMTDAAAALSASLGIERLAQEAWAIASHAKARASDPSSEIVVLNGQGRDPYARVLTDRTAARARVLSGSITTATTAVAADAAAFVVMVAADVLANLSTRPLQTLELLAGCTLGADPEKPGLAPVPAIARAMAQAGLTATDLHRAEIMEAYAVQAIACVDRAGLDRDRVNPGGGALASGHPIGASGAILAVRLFHGLQAGQTGLAAIASAGGLGSAALFRAH